MALTSRHGTRGGFTLVELLVVVAIIAVLVAMLLPVLQQAKKSAKRAQCVNNLRQCGVSLHLYADDYADYLPVPAYWSSSGSTAAIRWNQPINQGLLYPYLGYNAVPLFCADLKDYDPAFKYLESPTWAAEVFKQAWNNGFQPAWTTLVMILRVEATYPPGGKVVNPWMMPGFASPPYIAGKLSLNSPPSADRTYPVMMCNQGWHWSYRGGHDGIGSNILYADGKVGWFQYPFKATGVYDIGNFEIWQGILNSY